MINRFSNKQSELHLYNNLQKLAKESEDEVIRNIAKVVREKYVGFLPPAYGSCIQASDKLYEELVKAGIQNIKSIEGYFLTDLADDDTPDRIDKNSGTYHWDHSWIEIGDNKLDITSDQFNYLMTKQLNRVEYPADPKYYQKDIVVESN